MVNLILESEENRVMVLPKTLVVVRHGESEGNVVSTEDISFRTKPNHQFSLTEKGRKQAIKAGDFLKTMEFDAYFVSTYKRTQETMSLVCPGVVPIVDSRLNEHWRGVWHTMPGSDVDRLFPMQKVIADREGRFHDRPFGGQCGQDVELGIYSFLTDLCLHYSGKNIIVAGHGNWMIFLWRVLYGFPTELAEERFKSGKYENGSIIINDGSSGKWKLVYESPKSEKW